VLRRPLPKGTDLSVHSQADRDAIALHHNAKLRRSLGLKLPVKLFLPPGSCDVQAHWATTSNPVALGA
jgi:IS30 family transposase